MRYFFCLGILVLFMASCGEFLEENINNEKVKLIAPGDSLKTSTYAQNFFWQSVVGARNYHLQIAQPSFDSLQTIVLDTILKTTKYSYSLSPGKYQWRVSALNAGYTTDFSTRTFEIFPSSLAEQQVILSSPANELLSNQDQVSFSWMALFGAKSYTLQLDTNSFSDTTRLVLNQQLGSTNYNFSIINDQNYQWRVRAQNDTAKSAWSAVRRFSIDRKAPVQVNLVSPANSAAVASPVNFIWQSISDAKQYEIYVYASDSTILSSYPKTSTTTNFSFNGGTLGNTYLWRVRGKDAVGNIGVFSLYRSFMIQ